MPKHVMIEIDTEERLLDYHFDSCIREEIAHAFFFGSLPDRNLRFYEMSMFNRNLGYQALIEDYTWTDRLAMRVLLYAIKNNRRNFLYIDDVIDDYFLSLIIG